MNIINILKRIKKDNHTHEIRTGCCGRESIRDPGNENRIFGIENDRGRLNNVRDSEKAITRKSEVRAA